MQISNKTKERVLGTPANSKSAKQCDNKIDQKAH